MRSIMVSTSVFAAIWAVRQGDEDSESEILERLLDCRQPKAQVQAESVQPGNGIGFHDARNGVHFPEGFEIFRKYDGLEYRAIATNGSWIRQDTGKAFRSLNQLNQSITRGTENVWIGSWRYLDSSGIVQPIRNLRTK
ncbi:MAG: hypothetical protein QOH47_1861 [Sphingomonadales bacterium]|jgi:hypothetical protein|nr:hypothetical protein [Sphingomonadales bacterium]